MELESSILFKVPKETNPRTDQITKNENDLSNPLINTVSNEVDSANRNLEPLVVNNASPINTEDKNSKKKKVIFQGVPRHAPINVDSIGLKKSPRIAELQKKARSIIKPCRLH